MSNSVNIPIFETAWTEISEGVRYGFFTNNSDRTILYRSAITNPGAGVDIGHRLHPGSNKSYVLTNQEKVWARAVHALGTPVVLVVTPGYNTFTSSNSISRDYLDAVNRGDVEGANLVHKFGKNIDIGVTKEDIWASGGILQWLTAAETMDIVSTDIVNDISTGIGARSVLISGLDDNFDEITEIIALAAAPVTTINSFRRIQTARIVDVGTYTGANLGDISITATSSATIQGLILVGDGRTNQTHFTVPVDKTGYVLRTSITMNANKEVNVNLHRRQGADIIVAPFKASIHFHSWGGINSPINERFLADHILPEKTDVWFDGQVTSTPDGSIDVDYAILLIDN